MSYNIFLPISKTYSDYGSLRGRGRLDAIYNECYYKFIELSESPDDVGAGGDVSTKFADLEPLFRYLLERASYAVSQHVHKRDKHYHVELAQFVRVLNQKLNAYVDPSNQVKNLKEEYNFCL